MKRLILISCFLCFVAITAHAQKVYKQGAIFVIECAGMPAGSYTKTLKSRSLSILKSAASNTTVAYKFEIAANDQTASGWAAAGTRCAGLAGGNWRLPTQRELQLIWIERGKLEALSGFSPFKNTASEVTQYWAATEYSSTQAWVQCFNVGHSMNAYTAADTRSVRCCRDFL